MDHEASQQPPVMSLCRIFSLSSLQGASSRRARRQKGWLSRRLMETHRLGGLPACTPQHLEHCIAWNEHCIALVPVGMQS